MKIPNLIPRDFRSVSELDYPKSRLQNDTVNGAQQRYGGTQSVLGKKSQIAKNQKNIRGKFMNLFKLNELQNNKASDSPDPLTENLKDLWQQRLDAANLAIESNRGKFIGDGKELQSELALKQEQLNQGILPKSEHRNFEKNLKKSMVKHINCIDPLNGKKHKFKYASKELKRMYKKAVVDDLNGKSWTTVHNQFEHHGTQFHDVMIPAAQMKSGGYNIFEIDYKGKGVSSGTTKSHQHATNLWNTEANVKDKNGMERPIFKATRHGINSAYGLKGKEKRENAALSRSREVILAALDNHKPEELKKSIKNGAPISLKLTSTSLVTALNAFGVTEGKQMSDQVGAWNKLNAMSNADGGIKLNIRDDTGALKQITVKLEVAALNFGVNEAALTQKIALGKLTLFKLDAGWKNSDKVNEQGLQQLLGEDLSSSGRRGGWVNDYLKNNPNAKNSKLVKELDEQICEIWEAKSHRTDKHKTTDGTESAKGDPYKMAARIALLTYEIGAAPCFNCKSGKDRTASLDSEVKFLAAIWDVHGRLPRPGEKFIPSDEKLYQEMYTKTGSGEIQKKNTGIAGNKTMKKLRFNNLSLDDRLNNPDVSAEVKGGSKSVVS